MVPTCCLLQGGMKTILDSLSQKWEPTGNSVPATASPVLVLTQVHISLPHLSGQCVDVNYKALCHYAQQCIILSVKVLRDILNQQSNKAYKRQRLHFNIISTLT